METKWQYLVVTSHSGGTIWTTNGEEDSFPARNLDQLLNHLGDKGWELIAVTGSPTEGSPLIFKRPSTD